MPSKKTAVARIVKREKSAARNRSEKTRSPAETNELSEQDYKRRIGQHSGTGPPRLMKK